MNDAAVFILVVLAVLLFLIYVIWVLAAGLFVGFFYFVANIPTLLALLLFILFPPTLIAFLIGGVLTYFLEKEPEESTPQEPVPQDKTDALESAPRAWAEAVEDPTDGQFPTAPEKPER